MLLREQDAFFYDLRQRAAKRSTRRRAGPVRPGDEELEDRIIEEFSGGSRRSMRRKANSSDQAITAAAIV